MGADPITSTKGMNALRFRVFKWSVYGLLALNLGLFLLFETLVEALDSLGWLVLLGVFEWETSTLGRPRSGGETAALWAAQGRGHDARALLRPVFETFAEGLDTADLTAAGRLLATLG